MKLGILGLLCLCIIQPLFANSAVDELNALLLKKERVAISEKSKRSEIQALSQHYYFAYIFRSTCPHCQKFTPILKDFADSFHIEVQALSLDNDALEEFDTRPLTPELFQAFYSAAGYKPSVPALFLVNRHTLEAHAVLFGEATSYQLARRVHELQQPIEEKFHD